MKVIFLDLDGVLNTEVFVRAYYALIKDKKNFEYLNDEFGIRFDPMACDFLSWIIESTGAKIIISSSWRFSGLEEMKKMWEFRNLPGEIMDITPVLHLDNENLSFEENGERGHEIDLWLSKHKDVENYLILDDDNDFLEHQRSYFIQTDFRYGLTYKDVLKAIKILSE